MMSNLKLQCMRKLIGLCVFLMMLGIQLSMAQERQVTGTVTDASDGTPLPGVTIVIKGTSTGTSTDIDGHYALNVPGDVVLVFSFVGMKSQEIAIGTKKVIDVKLENESMRMDEVLVTAMGLRRAERGLGYSVAKVDADEGVQKAEPDILRALDGKIPGVVINAPSGAAGSATRITIRGNSSFLGNNQPLYVVDGIPYSNNETTSSNQASEAGGAYGSGLSTLDPNDIESMSVLKGAAASALYGSRAANGVVLITTKSGSKKTNAQKGLEVTLTGSYTIETIGKLPDYQNKYGTGNNFIPGGANGSWGADFAEVTEVPLDIYGGGIYRANYPDLPEMVPYKAYKNNVKDLFRIGGIYEGSLNISQVGEKGNFNTTISRMKQDSYIPHADFERYSIGVGGNYELSNGLRVGGNLSYSRTIQHGPMYGNNQSSGIGASSFARALILGRSWDMSLPYETPSGGSLFFVGDQADNPLWSWKNNKIETTMDRTVAKINLGYDFLSWLSVDYTLGINDYKMDRKEVLNLGSRALGGKGRILTDEYTTQEIESTLLININKDITEDIGFKATLGNNVNQLTETQRKISGLNIMSPGVYNLENTESQTAEEYYSRRSLWALFADITFDFKNYLFLGVSARNDWSSTLPKDHRSYFYPAVTASFVFTDAFHINSNALNFGKIRASWAKVGNDASPYYNNGTYLLGQPYLGQAQMALRDVRFDPKLKPEFTSEVEVGLDLQMFNSRLNLDFSYYNRNSTDQIAPLSLPYSTGYTSYYTNFGKMNNHGLEIGLDATPVIAGGFKWNLYGTFSKNWSEVKELVNGVEEITVGGAFSTPKPVLKVGEPYGILKGTKLARDEEGNLLVDPNSGAYLIADEEGIIGDPNPDFKASLSNTFSYRGFSFNIMFDLQYGGCMYSTYVTDLLGRGVTKDTEDRLGTRILPGVLGDPTTKKPLLNSQGQKIPNYVQMTESDLYFVSSSSVSTFAINGVDEVATYDATVLRLRELSLSYDFPKRWLKKNFLGSASLSFVARNLWFYAPNVPKHTNYDPTAGSYGGGNVQGIDYTSAPSAKRYGFNLKLTF